MELLALNSTTMCAGLVFRPVRNMQTYTGRAPDETDAMFSVWAMGYISGINTGFENDFFDPNAKSLDEMTRYLRRYCDIHPLANYRDGVLEFMKSLPIIKHRVIG